MCGIAGFLRDGFPRSDERELRRMGDVIAHRGPDASGEFLDEEVGLVHRRLSIIDLSPLGNQPMFSGDGRYVVVFNGEIYNFPHLRRELESVGCTFRSRTDTEVILNLYELEGPHCLTRLHGMFAFAIWDRVGKTLFLARDRIGKKPLYYFHDGAGRFAFASEIKSLLELPGVPRETEPTAVVDYLAYLYIPAPKTIFHNIYKLLPGHSMIIEPGGSPRIAEYWDVNFSRKAPQNLEIAAGELLELVERNTTERMISDVPLGAFLSGGIDSSAVVALMSRSSQERVRTCSIGFNDPDHDESTYAREVAKKFNTEHFEYRVSENLAETVTLLPRYFDEPFADSSAVPTYHVSRLARQAVTVALAGDGGDENFGGYEKYVTELREDLVRRTVPKSLLRAANNLVSDRSRGILHKAYSLTASALAEPGRGFYRTNTFMGETEMSLLLSDGLQKLCSGYDPAEHTLAYWNRLEGADHVTRMLYTDVKTYLPGDILVKVDRMSMANSLEVRAPLLDHQIVEFAASLPPEWKIKGTEKKRILKKSFGAHLPPSILHRRKHGFTVPLDDWFRNDLRRLGEEHLLQYPPLEEFFSLPRVREIWQEHQQRRKNHGTLLWSLLSFSLWRRHYLK